MILVLFYRLIYCLFLKYFFHTLLFFLFLKVPFIFVTALFKPGAAF